MKSYQVSCRFLICWFLLQGYMGAAQAQSALPAGRIVGSVPCAADPSYSYAVYIPAKVLAAAKPAPVIYFFDPHGDGALPLSKYKALAEGFGFVMVGSNDSRNGNDWSKASAIWQAISRDTKARCRIDGRRVYTAGFSGGAKVASYIAIQDVTVRGCIAGGTGLPDGVTPGNFPFSLTILAGEGDMNLTELVRLSGQLDKTQTTHRLISFAGRHEWAPAASMRMAFAALAFDAMKAGVAVTESPMIRLYAAESRGRVEEAVKKGALIQAVGECHVSAGLLEGLSGEAQWFRSREASITAGLAYEKQRQGREALLAKEGAIKNDYMRHFQDGDMRYWGGVVNELNVRTAEGAPGIGPDERAMYQRLQAYLSLAFYSLSNRLITAGENAGARHFVDLYKLADPTNTEAWYFSAVLFARAGNIAAAKQDLQRAIGLGFKDRGRVSQQREFSDKGIAL